MKKTQIVQGRTYAAKVSGQIVPVRIERPSPYGGWVGRNLRTGREVHVRSPQRLRYEITRTGGQP